MRETHEIMWSNTITLETPKVLTISEMALPEIIIARKMSGCRPNTLIANVLKINLSMKAPLFIQDLVVDEGVRISLMIDHVQLEQQQYGAHYRIMVSSLDHETLLTMSTNAKIILVPIFNKDRRDIRSKRKIERYHTQR